MKIKHLLPLLLMSVALTRVTATIVVPPTFEQLVGQAELIFQGTVTEVRSVWEGQGGQRHIETYVTFQVADNLKGDAGSSYTIRMLGGTVGEDTMKVVCAPEFHVGEEQVLFVEHNYDQFVPLVGIMHGQMRVQVDEETGRRFVVDHDGEALRNLSQLGRDLGAAFTTDSAQAISIDDLKRAIKTQLNVAQ